MSVRSRTKRHAVALGVGYQKALQQLRKIDAEELANRIEKTGERREEAELALLREQQA